MKELLDTKKNEIRENAHKQMIIGITGSIGSGKTTAAKLFSRHWYNRIDADEIAHELMKRNSVAYKEVVNNFGNKILDKNKNINKKKLGDLVFNNSSKLKKLNSIMHPIIILNIKKRIAEIKKRCPAKTRIVIDAPLLLETEAKNLIDKVIVIKCNKGNILKRNKKFPKEQIERILKSQMPLNEKLKYADFLINNNKDLNHLKNQVERIIKKIE